MKRHRFATVQVVRKLTEGKRIFGGEDIAAVLCMKEASGSVDGVVDGGPVLRNPPAFAGVAMNMSPHGRDC